jgi:hypothetical protein
MFLQLAVSVPPLTLIESLSHDATKLAASAAVVASPRVRTEEMRFIVAVAD